MLAGSRENTGKASGGNEQGFGDVNEGDSGNKLQLDSILVIKL